jgi:predicted MPP superfamily phosphohydrolase
MSLFFITFFSVYGGMHLYVFFKARNAFHLSLASGVPLLFLMSVMTFAPFIIRISERHGLDLFARFSSYVGYIWLGMIFLFFVFSLLLDFYRLLIFGVEMILQRSFIIPRPSPRMMFAVPFLLAVSISILGYFEARHIRTEMVTIKTQKIPDVMERLRIVQISDVHTGLIVRGDRLKKIVNAVMEADPDILISTGDLVDGQINNLSDLSELLKGINPKYGKFAIPGNHEYYAGFDQSVRFTEESGFTVLKGEALTVGGIINIAGVDDPAGKRYGLYKDISEEELLARFPKDTFTLLLKHRPIIDEQAARLFDLQLSGHTHKGQIFPFNLITKLYYPKHAGYMQIDEDTSLYVSRGSGTWGPPVRFLSPPEVTIIELVYDRNS